MSTPMKLEALKLFRTAIAAVDPYRSIKDKLVLTDSSQLQIGEIKIQLNRNLYVAAFGKAALSMCRAVDEICAKHLIKMIASVPVGAIEHAKRDGIYPTWKSSVDIYEGARDNLPDQAALQTAQRVQKMISETMCADDILFVLISGKALYARKSSQLFH